jgi:hypothetical protein
VLAVHAGMSLRLVCIAALLAGCDLYWGDHSGGDDCLVNEAAPQHVDLRDPQTGQCQTFGGSACNTGCGLCDNNGIAVPTWAICMGACEQIKDETQCAATANCHVTRLDGTFWGCWEVEPTGPVSGHCATLDAFSCTSMDSCVGLYTNEDKDGTTPQFVGCTDEQAPPPPAACDTLTTETACKARTDCEPIYNGSNCTCDPHSCTCQTETFAYCQ